MYILFSGISGEKRLDRVRRCGARTLDHGGLAAAAAADSCIDCLCLGTQIQRAAADDIAIALRVAAGEGGANTACEQL